MQPKILNTEQIYGSPSARRFFCGTRTDGPFRTGIKCDLVDYSEFTEREGIVPMPRLSVTGWIRVEKGNALSSKEWKRSIKKSYDLVVEGVPKKVRERIGK